MTAYPLGAVLALREGEAGAATAALARALRSRDALREELARRDAALAHRTTRAEDAQRANAAERAPGGLAARARWAGRLRAECAVLAALRDAADRAAADAEGEVDARRADLAGARAALRAIEAHRDGWQVERARQRDRREQDESDDLVSARWRAGR